MSDKPVTLADGTPVPKQSNTDYDVVVDEKCCRVRLISCAYCHAVAPEVADHTAAKEWAIRHVRDECQLSPTADLRSRLARAEAREKRLRDALEKALSALDRVWEVASGECQVAMDDTQGMEYIADYVSSVFDDEERAALNEKEEGRG